MKDYLLEICNYFVCKYENSNRSIGGKSKKRIILFPNKAIKGYKDDFDICQGVNAELQFLTAKGYAQGELQANKIYQKIVFVESVEALNYFYAKIGKEQKQEKNARIKELLNRYKNNNDILRQFCAEQINNLALNKNVQYFDGKQYNDFEDILKGLSTIQNQNREIYIRVLSKEVFNDSKKLETLKSKLESILYRYGDFVQRETVFEELNIVKTPSFIYIKGDATLTFANNNGIAAKGFMGGYGLCSLDVDRLTKISIPCKNVVTVENLTNYFLFEPQDSVAIYLGGFHNTAKRLFLKKLFLANNHVKFYHFGDIDAGGFYILEHLKRKTGIDFKAMHMDVATLEKYRDFWQPLTCFDRSRLTKLKKLSVGYNNVIDYMLKHNCKFEQEAVCLGKTEYGELGRT